MSYIDAAMSAPCGREKAVLIALAASAPRIILSLSTIAERSGVEASTVRRHIDALEALGLIEVYEQPREGGDWNRRPPARERSRSVRRLAFVLHLPDAKTGRTYSTRHPADETGLPALPDLEQDWWRERQSVHC